MEGDGGDWNFSKLDKKNPRIGFRHRLTENGLTLIWFPTCERAKGFFHNTFRNPFKETGFPTSHGFEAFFVPCITSPVFSKLSQITFILTLYIHEKALQYTKHTYNIPLPSVDGRVKLS